MTFSLVENTVNNYKEWASNLSSTIGEIYLYVVNNANLMCTFLSLGTPSISFLSVLKGHKGIIAHEFVLSFLFLNFSYLVLFFFFLAEKPEEP